MQVQDLVRLQKMSDGIFRPYVALLGIFTTGGFQKKAAPVGSALVDAAPSVGSIFPFFHEFHLLRPYISPINHAAAVLQPSGSGR